MPDQSSAATEHAILQEITRPLQSLPDDPLSVVNAEFPMALRGYDRDAVDDYVRRTRQLVAELQATRSPESAVRRALERVGEEITGILQRAHETAEQITAQSRREAEDRLEQARQEAAQVSGAAEQRVRELDADTDRIWLERQRIVADAEDLAAQLVSLANTAGERFPADGGAETTPVDRDDGADASATPDGTSLATDEDEEEYYEDLTYRPGQLEAEPDDDVEQTVAFKPLSPRRPLNDEPASPPQVHVPSDEPASPSPIPDTDELASPSQGPADGGEPGAESPAPAEDPTTERHPVVDEPLPGPDAPGSPMPGSDRPESSAPASDPAGSEDTTAVIRPASQAANRRLSQ